MREAETQGTAWRVRGAAVPESSQDSALPSLRGRGGVRSCWEGRRLWLSRRGAVPVGSLQRARAALWPGREPGALHCRKKTCQVL